MRNRFLADHIPSIAVIWVSVFALSIGWRMFTGRLTDRSDRARAASSDVARIWGGPLAAAAAGGALAPRRRRHRRAGVGRSGRRARSTSISTSSIAAAASASIPATTRA